MNITVEQVREKYPHPVKYKINGGNSRNEYCVGGAFCLFVGVPEPFPLMKLARALTEQNPRLHWKDAERFAARIVGQNDSGNFEEAWRELGRALNFHGHELIHA